VGVHWLLYLKRLRFIACKRQSSSALPLVAELVAKFVALEKLVLKLPAA
jgi:hypothetical protein